MPKRTRDNLDLTNIADSALAGVARDDLIALLRAVATAEAWEMPWDGNTVVMASDRWSRISASVKRCLQKAKL